VKPANAFTRTNRHHNLQPSCRRSACNTAPSTSPGLPRHEGPATCAGRRRRFARQSQPISPPHRPAGTARAVATANQRFLRPGIRPGHRRGRHLSAPPRRWRLLMALINPATKSSSSNLLYDTYLPVVKCSAACRLVRLEPPNGTCRAPPLPPLQPRTKHSCCSTRDEPHRRSLRRTELDCIAGLLPHTILRRVRRGLRAPGLPPRQHIP